jgi:hypothetical protein
MSEMVIGKRNCLISDWLSNRFRAVVRASLTLSIGPSATKSNRTARKVGFAGNFTLWQVVVSETPFSGNFGTSLIRQADFWMERSVSSTTIRRI